MFKGTVVDRNVQGYCCGSPCLRVLLWIAMFKGTVVDRNVKGMLWISMFKGTVVDRNV